MSSGLKNPAPEESRSPPQQFGETRLNVSEALPSREGFRDEAEYSPRWSGWGFSNVDWCFVLAAQHWATLVWAAIFLISLGITYWVQKVTTRPFLIYDASISYINNGDTVSASASWLVPFAVLIINLVVLEFLINRKQNASVSHALALVLHFFIDAVCCFICSRLIVEITKLSAGRLRPDFLQDCYGLEGLSGAAQVGFANGSSAACTRDNADSRKSLPSGHASSSMVTIAYSIIYCTWTAYFRSNRASFCGLNTRRGFRGGFWSRLGREFAHSAFLVWNVAQFSFAWATGITRFTDNKHNVSDIVTGWFIGVAIAFIFVSRAIGLSRYISFHTT